MTDATTAEHEKQPSRPGWRRAWERARQPGWPRRIAWVLLVTVLSLAGAWVGVLVAGTERQAVGPFDTTMSLRPSTHGGTTVETPPLGELMLDTHDAPMRLFVQVKGLDAEKARKIAADPERLAGLKGRAVSDIRAGLVDLFVRTAVCAVVGGVGLALLVVRRVRAAAVAALVAVGATGLSYYATWATWNPGSIQEPRYSGLLTSAPAVVGNARDIVEDFDKYRQQLARLVTNVSRLYSTTSTLPVMAQQEDVVKVLHVSDLHLAPQAWNVISSVAHQYDVDVVVDSGDITDHGSAAENSYLDGVRSVDAPYVWVRGNHDSMVTQRAMKRIRGVTVLNGRPRTVAGIRFLGVGDPRFTPDNSRSDPSDDVVTAQAQALANVAREDGHIDAIVYHDPGPAAVFDGLAPTVLAGHQHRFHADLMPHGTWRMVEGSTGGSGLRALMPKDGPAPIQLSVLYLDRDTAQLRAWDHIVLGGLGQTSAEIDREIVEPDDQPVGDLPTPTPTGEVPATPLRRPTVTSPFPTPTSEPYPGSASSEPSPEPTPTAQPTG